MSVTTAIVGAAGFVTGVALGVVLCEKDVLRLRHLEAGVDAVRKKVKRKESAPEPENSAPEPEKV